MSSFKRKEPVVTGARRLVCAELESVIQSLSRPSKADTAGGSAEALARVSACVELVAPLLPSDTVRSDRKRLGKVRKTLDEARLGRQLVTRLDKLAKQAKLESSGVELKALRKALSSNARVAVALQARGRRFDPLVYRLVAELAELRGRVGQWREPKASAAPIAVPPGLAVCYRKARSAADRCATDAAHLPAAASALMMLVDAMTLVAKACPAMIKPQRALLADAADAAHRHALDVLLAQSATQAVAKSPLRAALDKAPQTSKHSALKRVAEARAFALAETPQAYARRLGAYWSAWRVPNTRA